MSSVVLHDLYFEYYEGIRGRRLGVLLATPAWQHFVFKMREGVVWAIYGSFLPVCSLDELLMPFLGVSDLSCDTLFVQGRL